MIAERVRNQITASRRKSLWMGANVPLMRIILRDYGECHRLGSEAPDRRAGVGDHVGLAWAGVSVYMIPMDPRTTIEAFDAFWPSGASGSRRWSSGERP